jgi:hypothetical protein
MWQRRESNPEPDHKTTEAVFYNLLLILYLAVDDMQSESPLVVKQAVNN